MTNHLNSTNASVSTILSFHFTGPASQSEILARGFPWTASEPSPWGSLSRWSHSQKCLHRPLPHLLPDRLNWMMIVRRLLRLEKKGLLGRNPVEAGLSSESKSASPKCWSQTSKAVPYCDERKKRQFYTYILLLPEFGIIHFLGMPHLQKRVAIFIFKQHNLLCDFHCHGAH